MPALLPTPCLLCSAKQEAPDQLPGVLASRLPHPPRHPSTHPPRACSTPTTPTPSSCPLLLPPPGDGRGPDAGRRQPAQHVRPGRNRGRAARARPPQPHQRRVPDLCQARAGEQRSGPGGRGEGEHGAEEEEVGKREKEKGLPLLHIPVEPPAHRAHAPRLPPHRAAAAAAVLYCRRCGARTSPTSAWSSTSPSGSWASAACRTGALGGGWLGGGRRVHGVPVGVGNAHGMPHTLPVPLLQQRHPNPQGCKPNTYQTHAPGGAARNGATWPTARSALSTTPCVHSCCSQRCKPALSTGMTDRLQWMQRPCRRPPPHPPRSAASSSPSPSLSSPPPARSTVFMMPSVCLNL